MEDRISASDVISTYNVMLGRPPENSEVIASHLAQSKTPAELVRNISASVEFLQRVGVRPQQSTPFLHPNSNVDVPAIVRSYIRHDRKPHPEFLVNFLNVRIPPKVMAFLRDRGGELDQVPLPANFHADMAEWASALRAVDLSGPKFTMVELGCGWGCWMSNTGVAAAWKGKQLDLIGVEGDSLHIEFAEETFAANKIKPYQFTLLRGIASSEGGVRFVSAPCRCRGALGLCTAVWSVAGRVGGRSRIWGLR